ncbi:alpha-amylase family glycosyl hydrolase [Georgenia faecalis]|uniref:Alpha-amylase family glycosyl hydrolase n=1 Tax=Georgenia faecalis TaxID=2483799 RepID=A0ABV9D6I5_9MICO|nr:alpha-amylase family glycosyl hydrolase [Georgenia faecalis]
MSLAGRLGPLLAGLYPGRADEVRRDLLALASAWQGPIDARLSAHPARRLDAGTAYLITYGDAIRRDGQVPLRALAGVLEDVVGDAVTDVHLLPLYPWTSDDGFAVVDHREVDPALGSWHDVAVLGARHGLMLDLVANHVSAASPWFSGWLAGDRARAGYFLDPPPGFDTSRVVRPRTTPLVHRFPRPDGTTARAWTTFGPDQVDVDVRTPAVLLDLTDVLLGYVARGATTVRLDAIGFLWKESGTTCLHLPQTHAVIQVWRALLDALAPGVRLLTETNVPHAENVAYFGDGQDEAHMVYQFALPPLVLHAFVTGDASVLTRWAASIGPVGPDATFFTFLASHDGIGMRPTEGLLDDDARALLVDRAVSHGGRVSWAARPDGTPTVYELNVNYLDALAEPGADVGDVVRRGLAAHSILLAMVGVPALYYHSLLGSSADRAGMEASGINRRINREVLDADRLARELVDSPRRRAVLAGLRRLLAVRRAHTAFAPDAPAQVETVDRRLLVVRRGTGAEAVTTVTNVSDQRVAVPWLRGTDLLTGREVAELGPHGFAWVRGGTPPRG